MDQVFTILDIYRMDNHVNYCNDNCSILNNKIILTNIGLLASVYIIPKIIDFFKILFLFL